MARSLLWKATVVHSTAITISLLFVCFHGVSQSATTIPGPLIVSFQCHACRFQDALLELERKTGLHFVYSSNIIDVQKFVTIDIVEKPVGEALAYLGRHLNLNFKKSGQHVVIKNNAEVSYVSGHSSPPLISAPSRVVASSEKKLSGIPGTLGVTASSAAPGSDPSVRAPVLGELVIKKPAVTFSRYFDPKKLPALPSNYLQSLNLNNNHPGWFLSAGFVVNDYSAGVELQAGLRSVYVVYRPAFLKDGRFHGAYGLGTSVLMEHNLSSIFQYTYAALNHSAQYEGKSFETISWDDFAYTSRHHRVAFMLQYSITRKVNLRGGLSINYLETTRYLPERGFFAAHLNVSATTSSLVSAGSFPYQRTIINGYADSPPAFQTIKTWIGWETTLSYRFNFYRK